MLSPLVLFFWYQCALQLSLWKTVPLQYETSSIQAWVLSCSSVFSPGPRYFGPIQSALLDHQPDVDLLILDLSSQDPSPNFWVSGTHTPATELSSRGGVSIRPDFLFWGTLQRVDGTTRASIGVMWGGGGVSLFPPFFMVPKIMLTSGCPALQRSAHVLFYLSISRFVIPSVFNLLAFLYLPTLKKSQSLVF